MDTDEPSDVHVGSTGSLAKGLGSEAVCNGVANVSRPRGEGCPLPCFRYALVALADWHCRDGQDSGRLTVLATALERRPL